MWDLNPGDMSASPMGLPLRYFATTLLNTSQSAGMFELKSQIARCPNNSKSKKTPQASKLRFHHGYSYLTAKEVGSMLARISEPNVEILVKLLCARLSVWILVITGKIVKL